MENLYESICRRVGEDWSSLDSVQYGNISVQHKTDFEGWQIHDTCRLSLIGRWCNTSNIWRWGVTLIHRKSAWVCLCACVYVCKWGVIQRNGKKYIQMYAKLGPWEKWAFQTKLRKCVVSWKWCHLKQKISFRMMMCCGFSHDRWYMSPSERCSLCPQASKEIFPSPQAQWGLYWM